MVDTQFLNQLAKYCIKYNIKKIPIPMNEYQYLVFKKFLNKYKK